MSEVTAFHQQGHSAALPVTAGRAACSARWRAQRLADWMADSRQTMAQLMVVIDDPAQLSGKERQALLDNCRRYNLSFYRLRRRHASAVSDKQTLLRLTTQLGLHRPLSNPCADADCISHIKASSRGQQYIPYTNKALGWHTDGYYQQGEDAVLSFAMHCARPAAVGGDNHYVDPAALYALIANENPDYLSALRHPQAFSIPANTRAGDERAACSQAVFSFDHDGHLRMRYTQRARNIRWRDDANTRKAVAFINEALDRPSRFRLRHKLKAGEGVIANNVLHKRSAFSEDPRRTRLLYRMRWPMRVGGRQREGRLAC